MGNYATLKAAIQDVIKTNGNNEITGALLQQSLLAMIDSLGVGYQYVGIATTSTNPGTPDQNVFYLASTAGTYTNFGGLVLADGEIAILKYNGAWSKDSPGAASLENVNQLRQRINEIKDTNTYGSAINVNGAVISAPGFFCTDFIPVTPGDVVKYMAGFSSSNYVGGRYLVAYKSDKVTRADFWGATVQERTITIPSTAAYIRATFKEDLVSSEWLKINGTALSIYGDIKRIDTTIASLTSVVSANKNDADTKIVALQKEIQNLNGVAIVDKAINGVSGALVSAPGFIATDFIPVSPEDVVKYNGAFVGSDYEYALVAYKSDKSTVLTSWNATLYERELTMPSNTAYIRATFLGNITEDSLKINDVPVPILGNIRKIVNELSSDEIVARNVFGDILPPLFKQKFYPADKDILVVCQGDSITGLVERTSLQPDPSHCPPGQQYYGWVARMQERVSKIKPMCDRLDSQRNDVDFFTKVGTWQNVIDIEREEIYYSDRTTYGQERSVTALTFQCADNLAGVSFVFDADTFDKCNLVFSKEPDGVLTKVVIAEGDGKMLASLDRTTWVEANGLQVTQRTFDADGNDYTHYSSLALFTQVCAGDGISTRERHRRIWLKKADGVTGEINISYQRDNSVAYADSYMYVWGVERYSGNAIFFDNIGRGGRETDKLSACISDVFDRNPDLCIYEMPLANETDHTLAELKATPYYGAYFLGNGGNSFKTRSEDYTSVPIIVVLPHGRSGFFNDENNAIHYSDQPTGQPVAYNFYKQMYGWLIGQLASYQNVKFINLYDQLINEILAKGYTIKDGTLGAEYAITADGVHLNDYGSLLWMAYLAPLFQ